VLCLSPRCRPAPAGPRPRCGNPGRRVVHKLLRNSRDEQSSDPDRQAPAQVFVGALDEQSRLRPAGAGAQTSAQHRTVLDGCREKVDDDRQVRPLAETNADGGTDPGCCGRAIETAWIRRLAQDHLLIWHVRDHVLGGRASHSSMRGSKARASAATGPVDLATVS